MGLLESIMRGLNIGGCSIEIHMDRQGYQQGSQIKGNVVVKGGKIPQYGDAILIELEEFWTEQRGSGKSSHTVTVYQTHGIQTFNNFSIDPGEEQNFMFNLRLPLNSRLSTSSTGWNIKVTIDIPNAVDPLCRAKLNVTPAVEFLAIAQACEGIQFSLKSKSWKWTRGAGTTYFRVLPSEEMKKEFDYIAFNLSQSGSTGGVSGSILFNLQEKSFMDYIRAVFLKDRIEKVFVLSREQIFLADGAINSESIINAIKPSLEEIIKSRSEYEGRTPSSPQPEKPSRPSEAIPPGKRDYASNDQSRQESKQKRASEKEFDPRRLDY